MADKIIIIQPSIQHYRLPVFDRLIEECSQSLEIEVCGAMQNGEAIGGGTRNYFRELSLKKIDLGRRPVSWWSGVENHIQSSKPSVVISTVYPSNLSCWRIPKICRNVGAIPIGWTKVKSPNWVPFGEHMKRSLLHRYEYMLAYGEHSRSELEHLGYAKERIFVTNNTIDTERIFEAHESYLKKVERLKVDFGLSGKILLLCIAKMEPQKRHQDLLQAWPDLKKKFPDLVLVLIGSGSLESQVKERAEKIDPEGIRFLGRVPAGQDYQWIAMADATIQCGAVGLAINQSMAFGKPTVIADEAGPDTESLIHCETGFRYKKGSIEDLIAKVTFALSGSSEVKQVTENATRHIRTHYTISNMVRNISNCIYTALGS